MSLSQVIALRRVQWPRLGWSWIPAALLLGLLVFLLAYPVLLLFIKSFSISPPGKPTVWGLSGWIAAFNDKHLPWALANTFYLAFLRIAITTVLAIFFAWVVTRTDTPFKGSIELMLWMGFFLPLLPMTMGWILLLDPHYGLLNRGLMSLLGLSAPPFNVFSYGGIVWCHLAFSTSVRFLLMTPAFKAMDAALEEAAETAGSNKFGVLRRITIPVLAPAIIASTALGFIKSLESFEVELVLGISAGIFVLPTKIWDFIHWEPPLYSRATALCSVFLVMILALIWLHHFLLRGKEYTTITGRGYLVSPSRLGRWRWVTCGFCFSYIFVMIVLPLATLLMGTFMELFGNFELEKTWTSRHWTSAFEDPIFIHSLWNTLALGFGAAVAGICFYALVSYSIVRTRFAGRAIMDILCWLPWALPGVLISLALLWAVLGSGSIVKLIYGTTSLLVLAIVIKEMPLGAQIIKAGILQVSRELEEASQVSGASWLAGFRRVMLPLLKPTLVAVGLIVFVSAIRDIPTIVFLATYRTRTLSLLMLDYMAGASMEKAAVLGLFIVFLIFVLLALARLLGFRRLSIES